MKRSALRPVLVSVALALSAAALTVGLAALVAPGPALLPGALLALAALALLLRGLAGRR